MRLKDLAIFSRNLLLPFYAFCNIPLVSNLFLSFNTFYPIPSIHSLILLFNSFYPIPSILNLLPTRHYLLPYSFNTQSASTLQYKICSYPSISSTLFLQYSLFLLFNTFYPTHSMHSLSYLPIASTLFLQYTV
ncbi:hypothetical protein CEXT_124511 [Caerostris extrusa]|uniref:Uncharacterized protein n=1 Tax=Caerostris extrusa TaxID=172846 RepID=A0AAV4NDD8_CAEEX|nr:hypothetical protein CEXT_124511 [Caerostris extrusa]